MNMWNWTVVGVLVMFLDVSTCLRHIIYWDNVMTPTLTSQEGMAINVNINEWMEILCPYYQTEDSFMHHPRRNPYLQLYNVTEEDFRKCITQPTDQVLLCNDPGQETKLTTKFQRISPSPFGFVFRPGQTYYYISRPIHERTRAGCEKNVMKLKVQVHHRHKGKHHDKQTLRTYHVIQTDHMSEEEPSIEKEDANLFKTKKPAEEPRTSTKLSWTAKQHENPPRIAHSQQHHQNGENSAHSLTTNIITTLMLAISLMLLHI